VHRPPARRAALAGLLAVLALAACGDDGGDATSDTTAAVGTDDPSTVQLVGLRFEPEVLTVPAGTEVTWEWTENLAHNVVGDDFQSAVQPRGSYSHTFTETGEHDYVCTLHPGMEGTIVVE
jgi:plastocyanin